MASPVDGWFIVLSGGEVLGVLSVDMAISSLLIAVDLWVELSWMDMVTPNWNGVVRFDSRVSIHSLMFTSHRRLWSGG